MIGTLDYSMDAIPSIIMQVVVDVDLSISPSLFDLIIIRSSFTSNIGILAASRKEAAAARRDDVAVVRSNEAGVIVVIVDIPLIRLHRGIFENDCIVVEIPRSRFGHNVRRPTQFVCPNRNVFVQIETKYT